MSETTSFPFMGSSLHTVRPCRASGMTTFAVGIGGVATGVFTPGSLPGIQFWYDAGAISGVTSGTSLSVWTDMSGNERHASNSLVTEQPLYVNNIINGYPGVRFVPNNDVLVAPTSGITVDGWTAFCVSVLSTAAGTNDIWVNNRYTMGAATDSAIVITLGVKTYTSNVSFFTAGTAVLYTQVFQSGATANFYKNGSLQSLSTGGGGSQSASSLSLGNRAAFPAPWRGDIAEIVAYNRILTADEKSQVESYMSTKWGTP